MNYRNEIREFLSSIIPTSLASFKLKPITSKAKSPRPSPNPIDLILDYLPPENVNELHVRLIRSFTRLYENDPTLHIAQLIADYAYPKPLNPMETLIAKAIGIENEEDSKYIPVRIICEYLSYFNTIIPNNLLRVQETSLLEKGKPGQIDIELKREAIIINNKQAHFDGQQIQAYELLNRGFSQRPLYIANRILETLNFLFHSKHRGQTDVSKFFFIKFKHNLYQINVYYSTITLRTWNHIAGIDYNAYGACLNTKHESLSVIISSTWNLVDFSNKTSGFLLENIEVCTLSLLNLQLYTYLITNDISKNPSAFFNRFIDIQYLIKLEEKEDEQSAFETLKKDQNCFEASKEIALEIAIVRKELTELENLKRSLKNGYSKDAKNSQAIEKKIILLSTRMQELTSQGIKLKQDKQKIKDNAIYNSLKFRTGLLTTQPPLPSSQSSSRIPAKSVGTHLSTLILSASSSLLSSASALNSTSALSSANTLSSATALNSSSKHENSPVKFFSRHRIIPKIPPITKPVIQIVEQETPRRRSSSFSNSPANTPPKHPATPLIPTKNGNILAIPTPTHRRTSSSNGHF